MMLTIVWRSATPYRELTILGMDTTVCVIHTIAWSHVDLLLSVDVYTTNVYALMQYVEQHDIGGNVISMAPH